MKRFAHSLRIPLSLAAAALLGLGCGASDEDTQPELQLTDEEKISADINKLSNEQAAEWWRVRKALSKYQNVKVALDEGYIDSGICVTLSSGAAMGVHFFKPELMNDAVSDPYKPELLLYLPDGKGGYSLLGPEYWQANMNQGTPSVIGQPFDGPMPGHDPWMPEHYDLHVWLFKYNPDGLFGGFNSRAKCPAGYPTQSI